jgi:hypothetical protein
MISLLHPSRGRAAKSFKNAMRWQELAGTETELIVSIDYSDPLKLAYSEIYSDSDATVICNENSCVVEATNNAAKIATGDILLYLSDDFDCFPDWGKAVEVAVKDFKGDWLLKVDDCLQRFEVAVLTIPIMSRSLYKTLGYFWHPGYKSMFVDEDLYWTAEKIGALRKAPWLKFPHNHVSVGKAEDDETYRNSAKNWDTGKAFYQQRKQANFPL